MGSSSFERLLVVESVCGGGWVGRRVPPSLAAEAASMLAAVVEDLTAVPGIRVSTLLDERCPVSVPSSCSVNHVDSSVGWIPALSRALDSVDAVWLVAPESDGELLRLARLCEQSSAPLVSPDSRFIEIAGDKTRTCERLAAAGVKVPQGALLRDARDRRKMLGSPTVAKGNRGAGSLGSRFIESQGDLERLPAGEWRIEQWVPGLSVSVAVACGPTEPTILGTSTQRIADGSLEYLGGECPLPAPLGRRAARLALRGLAALPPASGYVGVDLVLGEHHDGRDDTLIEINPRLTTSYIGHRQTTAANLAAVVLAAANDAEHSAPYHDRTVSFTPEGRVHRMCNQ